jgi:hypothetical protein
VKNPGSGRFDAEVDTVENRVKRNYDREMEQEIASLIRIPDSFRKIVVVKDYMKPWKDENGIQYIGIEDFLLDESLIAR